jgi:PTH1 family peptidyl-tRNA hydrolase
MADWVLSGFHGRAAEEIAAAAARAAEAVECYIKEGADTAMNRYNG